MCSTEENEKARATITDYPTEMTPTICADAMQTALNRPGIISPSIIARGLRGLCRWMSRVYQCIDDRMTKLEENTPNNTRIEILDCRNKQLEAQLLKHTHARSGLPPVVPPAPADALEAVLNSQVMRDTCPDAPMGVEQARPLFCHQCGIKL